MSSILDALERAEQERNALGGEPLHKPLSRPKHLWQRPGVWLLGVGLLLLNLLVWWLMLDSGEAPQIARVEPESAKFAAPTPPLADAPLLAETNPPPVVQPTTPTPVVAKVQPAVKQAVVIPPDTTVVARGKTASETQLVAPVNPVQDVPHKADRSVPPLLEAAARPAPPVPAVAKAQPVAKQPAVTPPDTAVAGREKTASVTQSVVAVDPAQVAPAQADLASVPPLLEAVAKPEPVPVAPPLPTVAETQPVARQPAVPIPPTSVASTDKVAPVSEAAEPIKPLAKPPALKQEPAAEAPKIRAPLKSTVHEEPAAEPEVAQAPAEVEVEAVIEEEERIPHIWQLSEAVQKRLKNLKINIHVYNEVPEQRFVIIDMHRYREGDALAREGLKLERITRDGVVIDYGKGLVRI